ncbi:MAG: hypothetical protein GXY83_30705 [Rhodopirellula sp.]|nr:hypothetical protein [Rhodopirellula sp.]
MNKFKKAITVTACATASFNHLRLTLLLVLLRSPRAGVHTGFMARLPLPLRERRRWVQPLQCRVGDDAWRDLPRVFPTRNGISYLHLQSTATEADPFGVLIESVAAAAEGESS